MSALQLVIFAVLLTGLSGFPALFMSSKTMWGQRVTVALFAAGGLIGLAGSFLSFAGGGTGILVVEWSIPWGEFSLGLDALSGFFLITVFFVTTLGSVYSLGYWKQTENSETGKRLGLSYGLLAASMAMVLLARDGVLFLMVWEIMALSAFFAATAEDSKSEVRHAGWIYLVATHAGTLILFAMFSLWQSVTGSFTLAPAAGFTPEMSGILFILALAGFGFKAGIMPLHVWLPGAHANAPSHVSAVMSGVMLKMGIYGVIRMTSFLPAPEFWWGGTLLVIGAFSGIIAIAFALGQDDIKRFLAYSSIENIGVIFLGIGLALIGRSAGRDDLSLLGMGGALFHVMNHGLFKSLLFMGAGSVIHTCHTRDMEKLGGLYRMMPVTGTLFFIGAVAISALPPLNGFASEWLVYLGLFSSALDSPPGLVTLFGGMAAAGLAMIGAMALAAFVRAAGMVFLGSSRSLSVDHAHDPEAAMIVPMAVSAAASALLGLFPFALMPILETAVTAVIPLKDSAQGLQGYFSVNWTGIMGGITAVIALILLVYLKRFRKAGTALPALTWDCGYAMPTARMQYTATSFARSLTGLMKFFLRPKMANLILSVIFPRKAHFSVHVPDALLDRIVLPAFRIAGKKSAAFRIFQQGVTQVYVLYIVTILVVLLIITGMGLIS